MKKAIGIAAILALTALGPSAGILAAQEDVDLNAASVAELSAVDGITEAVAKAIVAHRARSPFRITEDLRSVAGVTEEIYLKARGRFFVSAVYDDTFEDIVPEADDEGATGLVDAVGGQDSVLDDLRGRPLDLNIAQKTDLLDLPLVTSQLADAILLRRRQEPFKNIEELRSVKGMTDEIYRGMAPYIRVLRPEEREIFAGDIRFRIGPSISVSKPDKNPSVEYPYDNPLQIYNRTRFRFGSKYEAGFIIDAARWEPALDYQTIRELHLKKFYFRANDAFGFDRIIAGNYQLQYAQGLVFYYPFGELVRPIKVKARGPKVDTGTNPNAYFRGVAVEKKWQAFDLSGFYSYKGIYADLNADGTAKFDLESDAKMDLGSNTSDREIARQNNLYEELLGGRVQWNFAQGTHISLIGYDAVYSPTINPQDSAGNPSGLFKFRGDGNTVLGGDFDTWVNGVNFFGEYAKSYERGRDKLGLAAPYDVSRSGDAWLMQMMYAVNKFTFYMIAWDYDPDYINPHGSAVGGRSMRDSDFNQIGNYIGTFYKTGKLETNISFKPVKYKVPEKTVNYPGVSNDFWYDIKYKPSKEYEFYYRAWNHYYDDNIKVSYTDPDTGVTTSETTDAYVAYLRNRYQITYKPNKNLQLKARFDDSRKISPDYYYEQSGWLSYFDIGYKMTSDMKLSWRYMFYDSPYFAMSSIDDMWPRVLVPMFWTQGRGKGRRWYLAVSQKLDRNTEIWMRYENLYSISSNYDSHTFKLQFDYKWGAVSRRTTRQRAVPAASESPSESQQFYDFGQEKI
ncbi:MAG: hypothetical protein CVU77_04055 [Elusimicrobia bacterium HGW-Elusimicrobia-1]|jgi:DNA uptake protein ComE-like DNA-binding protein|nr:MAG: hypothetical protein CVU77_04055 [Elusimicrobia bacterium HGW-Elusimicrobia-1]